MCRMFMRHATEVTELHGPQGFTTQKKLFFSSGLSPADYSTGGKTLIHACPPFNKLYETKKVPTNFNS